MGWIRPKVRWVAQLALFALAVHLVLSFGHVHMDGLSYQPLAVSTASAASQSDAASPDRPAHPYRDSTAHDFCALCANIGLLGSLLLPDASPRVMLRDFALVQFGHMSATIVSSPFRSFSQARAPPAA